MSAKRLVSFASLSAVVFLSGAFESVAQAQPGKLKDPLWTHAFDLAARKLGEADFTKDTKKYGVEAFKDSNNNLGIFISQVGSLASTGAGFQALVKPIPGSKGPEFTTGLDLPVRKAGEKDFKNAKTHSMEVFRDLNTDNWLYITEKGFLAATPAKGPKLGGDPKPRLSHSVDLGVRKGGDQDWKNALKFGVEVYVDPSTGNLVYICESGAIAVIPEDPATKVAGDGKDPEWLHGLDLRIRKSTEPAFNKDTKTLGVEAYRDANNGNILFITEAGNLTVAPGGKGLPAPTLKATDPKWTHGMNMRCRKVGEKEFSDQTQAFGVEVFRDENLGVFLYLAETGSLTAVKAP